MKVVLLTTISLLCVEAQTETWDFLISFRDLKLDQAVRFVVSDGLVPAKPRAENIGGLSSPKTATLPSDAGQIQAIMREQQFTLRISEKDTEKRTALLVIVPSKKLYWLGYTEQGVGDIRQFFVLGDILAGVSTFRGDVLNFYLSQEKLPTSNLEKAATAILEKRYAGIPHSDFDTNRYSVRMENVLGQFPFKQVTAQGEPAPKITHIAVSSGQFTISFKGGKKDDIEATITFGSDFRPVSATSQGKQVFPKH